MKSNFLKFVISLKYLKEIDKICDFCKKFYTARYIWNVLLIIIIRNSKQYGINYGNYNFSNHA